MIRTFEFYHKYYHWDIILLYKRIKILDKLKKDKIMIYLSSIIDHLSGKNIDINLY